MVDSKTMMGILGVIIFVGTGTIFVLDKVQMENTYVCTVNNITGIFESLSATSKTAYWTENDTQRSLVCRNGMWVKIGKWCSDNKIDCKVFMDKGLNVNETIPPEKYDEFGAEIIYTKDIVIKESKTINVNGTILNITYEPKIVTKCICDKTTGCLIKECINN